ncbi:MAG: 4Fe-4S dicluster domain-containing protein, partial [Calditrichia bacterium]
MAELTGVDLGTHLKSIVAEYRSSGSIYNYPERKFYRGFPGYDFSVKFHDKIAATPLGPASGPHTQMAQNIVLSFLGGGRIVELKTVQILDELNIPRPCIDVRNVGFNVEWSQELRLQDSYLEYVKGWILLKLIEELEILGIPRGNPFYSTVFDISVGYDLEGISSQQIYHWLENMKNASAAIGEMMETLPQEFEHLRQIPIDPHIADSVTLSTFHGCPREEIEAIVQHLISEHNFHVVVKMNPTILGYEFVEETLRHNLGYAHIELDQAAFENDLQFNEGVAMMKRLQKFAEKHGRKVGAKFTNTLVVKNNQDVFSDEVMYLSGAPLHVLAMNAMHRFRSEMGKRFHISFSAGITKYNFADAVRCNMKPITTCTDLLKTGGYSRMFDYLKNLKKEMEAQGCRTIEQFIIRSCGDDTLSLEEAGMKNASRIVPFLVQNNRYHFEKNQKAPRKIDSHLTLFDCITCDKCIPVCPNAANFSYPTGKAELTMTDYEISDGKFIPVEGNRFVLKQECQIANIADFCNECGDCDTYCPEYGGPYVEKPRFFLFLETYRKYDQYDGFYFRAPDTLIGRIDGIEYSLAMETGGEKYRWKSPDAEIILSKENTLIKGKVTNTSGRKITVVMEPFYIMKTII